MEPHGQSPCLSVAAVPLQAPISAGFSIRKTLSALSRSSPERWSRGDILRVRLEIEAQADMTWVAVYDPAPAGALWRCPACASLNLRQHLEGVDCLGCRRTWPLRDGIYDFRDPPA